MEEEMVSLKKKPLLATKEPSYPEVKNAPMDRRIFLTILGVGTASFTALKGCFGSAPRYVKNNEEPLTTQADAGAGPTLKETEEATPVLHQTPTAGPDKLQPPGAPPMPNYNTSRIPEGGVHVTKLKDGGETSYVINVKHNGDQLFLELPKNQAAIFKRTDGLLAEHYSVDDLNQPAKVATAQHQVQALLEQMLGSVFTDNVIAIHLLFHRVKHTEIKTRGKAMPHPPMDDTSE